MKNPSGDGGRPAVQFRLACGECLQVPQEIVPEVLAAVRELAAEVGPDSPPAVHTPAVGGFVKGPPLVGEGAGGGCTMTGRRGDEAAAACPGLSPTVPGARRPEGVGDSGCDTSATGCRGDCRGVSPLVAWLTAPPACGRVLVHPEQSPTRRDKAGTRQGHPGADLPAQCEECGTGTHLMVGGAYAACARVVHDAAATAEDGGAEPSRARPGFLKGWCPACRQRTLIATWDGSLSCSGLECPDPGAAAGILEGRPGGWVRASEALAAVSEADEKVEGLIGRALAARRYAETLPAPVGDKILALLTGRAPLDTADAGAAVPAQPAGSEADR
ncbi:hypothetical protein [Streptomyces sp. NBC_01207]|uniref:hypothetical protein n=1 Tax=Streptomyces sp. NBC_01207 TaxID=2903772 RepID=UPI002E0E4A0B|nr:hypothetical protein OG457_27180 [Streptomyces sp. NBC_01207]